MWQARGEKKHRFARIWGWNCVTVVSDLMIRFPFYFSPEPEQAGSEEAGAYLQGWKRTATGAGGREGWWLRVGWVTIMMWGRSGSGIWMLSPSRGPDTDDSSSFLSVRVTNRNSSIQHNTSCIVFSRSSPSLVDVNNLLVKSHIPIFPALFVWL